MGRHSGPSTLKRWWKARVRPGMAEEPPGGNAGRPRQGTRRALIPVGLGLVAAGTYAVVVLLGHTGTRSNHIPAHPVTTGSVGVVPQGLGHASASTQSTATATSGSAADAGAAPTPLPARATLPSSTAANGGGAASDLQVGARSAARPGAAVQSAPATSAAAVSAAAQPPAAGTPVSGQAASGTAAVTGRTAAAPPPVLIPPVVGPVLSGFGWQYSTVFGDWQEHTGVDLAARAGQTAVSPGAGQVLAVVQDSLWGWVVSIGLDRGYSTNVSGLERVSVHAGQAVQAGTPLGVVGKAPPAEVGLAPHVFWQLFAGSRALNPELGAGAAGG